MKVSRVKVRASSEYEVTIGSGILSNAGDYVPEKYLQGTVAIITDDNVEKLYLKTVIKAFEQKAKKVISYTFPSGEENKNIGTLSNILEFLAENSVTRSDLIIALGGGVTGDMAGFAAGIYLRGIPFVGIPTTFLAAIDSSVGGKTGVDLVSGKNLAGVFNQPVAVITDTDTFKTVDDETFSDGTAESLKHGIIADNDLFEVLAQYTRAELMKRINEIVKRNVEIKAEIVASDEFDTGKRQLLNLGHTIGHAIEKCSNYKIPHGRAVATGIAVITRAANKLGYIGESDREKILAALDRHSFETGTDFSVDELFAAASKDKKRTSGTINIVVPKVIGNCELVKIPVEKLSEIISLGKE